MTTPDVDLAPDAGPAHARSPARPVEEPGGLRGRIVARLESEGTYPRWVLFAALAGMFATTFPITILTVSLGAIAREFAAPETTMAWVISAPMLLSAVALPLLGKLGDVYGHRRVFLLGFAGATATAVATVFAWSAYSLIALRTLSAVFGGATQPTAMALIFGVYAPGERVRAMGWWSMTTAAAPALGLVAGGPLVDLLGWRIVFALQALLSLLALVLAAAVLRETGRLRVRFDVAGALTLAVGVGGLMFALGRVRELGIASPWVLGAIALGALFLVVFVGVERRTRAPLLPLSLFASRRFTAPIVSNAFMGAAYMGAFVIAPLLLLQRFDFSIAAASGVMLLRTLSLTLSSPAGGALGTRIGERRTAMVGSGVMTIGLLLLAVGVAAHSLWAIGAALVLQGMGHGIGLPPLTSAASNAVAEQDLGMAAATNRLTGQVGAAFGITLLSGVYGGVDADAAFARAFLTGAALSVLSFAAAAAMHARGARPG